MFKFYESLEEKLHLFGIEVWSIGNLMHARLQCPAQMQQLHIDFGAVSRKYKVSFLPYALRLVI